MIPSIITTAYQTSRPDELDTEEILATKYYTLLHCRHDLLHHIVNQVLNLPDVFGVNRTLQKEFEDILPPELLKYSPDIVLITNTTCLIADVSCTWNREYHLNEKKGKYDQIVSLLRMSTDLTVPDFYLFWVDPAWSNLNEALKQFYKHLSMLSIGFCEIPETNLNQVKAVYEDLAEDIEQMRRSLPSELLFEDKRAMIKQQKIDISKLEKKSREHFPLYETIQKNIEESKQENVEKLFEDLVNDSEVFDLLSDTKHDETMFEKAFKQLETQENSYQVGHPKPTFFIPFADFNKTISNLLGDIPLENHLSELKTEQRQVLKFLKFVTEGNFIKNSSISTFLKKTLHETFHALKSPGELNIFNTGMLTGNLEQETSLNRMYTDYRSGKDSSVSKRQFFKNTLGGTMELRDALPYVYKNKCIKVTSQGLYQNDWLARSGTAYRKSHEVREYKTKTTVGKEHSHSMQDFMDLLNEQEDKPYKTHPFLGTESGPDVEICVNIKEGFLERQREFLSLIQRTKAHSFSKHSSAVVSQLLHFNELNTSPNTFCLMSGGRQNCIHIVRGGSLKRGQDVGQAFFTIFLTHDVRWASSVYGKVHVYNVQIGSETLYLCVTPWVRLSSTKLSFMKDQYYSTLSTAYDSWTRIRQGDITRQTIQMIYTFRVSVSLAPSQKVAELLMDTRYIVMAALSTYSNVFELILDKFQPPYSNVMEKHIIRQLRRKCEQIVVHFRTMPPLANKPGYSLNKRLQTTLGGKVSMPSLWSEEIVLDMQGLFDELFVYVHTSKEPSSNYHEQVRAMNTILKFQKQYNELSTNVKMGDMNFPEVKSWLLSGVQIGCHAQTVYWGSKLWGKRYTNLYKTAEFKDTCLTEPLSELESTKACIPEVSRKTVVKERSREDMNKVISNLGSLFKLNDGKPPKPAKTFFKIDVNMSEDVDMVITQNLRVKVHDSLLDWIKRSNSKADFTLDLALWNIMENDMRVIADTCIKAQYGAKREFYVINLGAKGMARVLENSYKCLAKHCRNEMISVPGDKKLEHIQSSVNEIILSSERRQDKIFYTNGDCTKWSACETMTSFVAFNTGLLEVFGPEMTAFNNAVFSSWADKQIQIPQTILSNLKYLSEQTSYITDTTTIHSTQNFLQGMFNYASSLKAVAATEFALHMFKKLNPNEILYCTHLEHSDDYSLVTRVKEDKVFEKFRVYHKLAQRLFGINDSVKKTNVQKHFLEFISLFSFNGQLFYPNIKKTKEVGTNLPCTNFKNDIMSVTSRTAEAVRLGVALESCYFLQRVHSASLADAYSLTPGMKNSYGAIRDCFSTPLELFGFPDCLPILHYVTKGSPESYRLYNYGSDRIRETYKKLFLISQTYRETEDLPFLSYSEDLGEFFSPDFSYPTRHNRLREIKSKLNLNLDQSREYFEANLTDTLIKPANSQRFAKWLEAMYFNKSFSQAYMSVSRATMTLRHSLFSSKPCILPFHLSKQALDKKDRYNFWTVKQHYLSIQTFQLTREESEKLSHNMAFKLSICSYNQSVGLIYDFLKNSKLIKDSPIETHTTVQKSPSPYQSITLENRVQLLLQFMVNPENFYSDRRKFLSETSLYRDIEKLSGSYNLNLLKTNMPYARQVMKELIAQSPSNSYGLSFDTQDTSVLGYVNQYISHGLFTGEAYRVVPEQKTKHHPLRPQQVTFARDWKTNSDTFTEVLYQLALLYRLIKLRCEHDLNEQLSRLLTYEIPELGTQVKPFLEAVDIPKLLSYKVGENAQKILAFLKMAILSDQSDMRAFLTGKLFYEFNYMPKHTCPELFDEWCVLKFQGSFCNAYYKTNSLGQGTIVLELPTTNRVLWFYFYTIAERVFGLISQSKFDLRMLHTYDMSIRPLQSGDTHLLTSLSMFNRNPQYFKINGKVIQSVFDPEDSNLPVLVQQVNFSHSRFNQKSVMNTISLYQIEGLSVYMGSVLMYTLPFGNLYCKNMLEIRQGLNGVFVDGLPLSLLQTGNRLLAYLKSDFTQMYPLDEIYNLLGDVWDNSLEANDKKKYSLSQLGDMFDLNVIVHPKKDWILKPEKTFTDFEVDKKHHLDIEDPLLAIPGHSFGRGVTEIITDDIFDMDTLEMESTEIGILQPRVTSSEADCVSKSQADETVSNPIGFQFEDKGMLMDFFNQALKKKGNIKLNKETKAKTEFGGPDDFFKKPLKSPKSSDLVKGKTSEKSEGETKNTSTEEIMKRPGKMSGQESHELEEETKREINEEENTTNTLSVSMNKFSPDSVSEDENNVQRNLLNMFSFKDKVGLAEGDPGVAGNSQGTDLSEQTAEHELQRLIKIDKHVEVIEDEGCLNIVETLGNIQSMKEHLSQEALQKQIRIKNVISAINAVGDATIEQLREEIILGDQPEEDLGELFETRVIVTELPHSESGSSEEGITNENPGYFQMVEHPSLLEQGYRFERRAREAMLPLPQYLLENWIKPDLTQICNNSLELGNLFKLLSGILTNANRLSLTKSRKALIKCTVRTLSKILGNTVCPFMIAPSKAVTFEYNTFKFWAVASYADRELRLAALNRNPKIKPIFGIENHTSSRFWAKAPLQQRDFDTFLRSDNSKINFGLTNKLSVMLSQLVPDVEEVMLHLESDYGF